MFVTTQVVGSGFVSFLYFCITFIYFDELAFVLNIHEIFPARRQAITNQSYKRIDTCYSVMIINT